MISLTTLALVAMVALPLLLLTALPLLASESMRTVMAPSNSHRDNLRSK